MEHSNRKFNIVLLVSILMHSVFLWELPKFKIIPPKKAITTLEVTYQSSKIKDMLSKTMLQPLGKRIALGRSDKGVLRSAGKAVSNPPAFIKNLTSFDFKKGTKGRLQTPPIEKRSVMKIVKLPMANSPFMKNPAYISYYQIIREKIKSAAYLDRSVVTNGEVQLSFVVNSGGQLILLKIIDEKSIDNQRLRKMAYGFIDEASPFPPFPPDLKHPQLSFNVIVEFKITN